LRPRLVVIISITALLTVALASPVAALSFDFHYFETDQMTYEVGETIDMVAKMIADYDEGGWCYVSFAVVTDHGPVFDEAYFISPSPDIRYFTSSYTIIPENTSPFPDPITAYVIFNVEIFDKYSQGASETIEVNITRGRIQARAISPMTIEMNSNASMTIGLASRYNENVSYSNEPVLVEIYNSTSDLVYSNTTITDNIGLVNIEWNSIPYPPGTYTIQVSGNGTSAFLPFSESLPMTIEPEQSSLIRVNLTETVYCQTPSGSFFDNVDITMDHVDKSLNPIAGSEVKWETSFASGNMSNQGNGRYAATIPFTIPPGTHDINVTAVHSQYQDATDQLWITVLPRNISAIITSEQILNTTSFKITVTLSDWQSGELLESEPLSITLSVNNWTTKVIGTTNSSGLYTSIIDVPVAIWGYGDIFLSLNSSQYYAASEFTEIVEILYTPQVFSEIIIPAARGEITSVSITIQDPLGFPTSSILVELLDTLDNLVGSGYTDSFGYILINWSVPIDSILGPCDYLIRIPNNIQHVQTISSKLPVTIYRPLWSTPSTGSWNFVRGTITTVEIYLESENGSTYQIPILFNDSMGEFSKYVSLTTGQLTNITFNTGFNITPGSRTLQIVSLNTSFILLEFIPIDVVVLTEITSQLSDITAYYAEDIEFNLTTLDDESNELDTVGIIVYLQGNITPFAIVEDTSTSIRQSINLPDWISPGSHQVIIEIYGTWSTHEIKTITIMVWIRTVIDISITVQFGGEMVISNQSASYHLHYLDDTMEVISSGSISLPPPTLFSDTISTVPPTDLATSPDSCPVFSSGTSNLSTVSENSLNSFVGNGQTVLNLKDLKEVLLSIIASSTDLEVLPKETTPHSASDGPETTTSVMRCSLFCIFFSSR
jgi:hypothetical protein